MYNAVHTVHLVVIFMDFNSVIFESYADFALAINVVTVSSMQP